MISEKERERVSIPGESNVRNKRATSFLTTIVLLFKWPSVVTETNWPLPPNFIVVKKIREKHGGQNKLKI